MRHLSLQDTADYLEFATIQHTNDAGHAIVHIGTSEAGRRFVLVNDCFGNSTLSESL